MAGWWEFGRLSSGSREERKRLETDAIFAWAGWDGVDDRIERGGVEALDLILALLEGAPDDDACLAVGAGPLQNLLHDHGNELIDQIERVARREPRFRRALTGVWLDPGDLDPAVEKRLSAWV